MKLGKEPYVGQACNKELKNTCWCVMKYRNNKYILNGLLFTNCFHRLILAHGTSMRDLF